MSEMTKLRNALLDNEIPFTETPYNIAGNHQIRFTNKNGDNVSVICGEHSYGGAFGLLETMPPISPYYDLDDVQGWLLAKEVIAAWV